MKEYTMSNVCNSEIALDFDGTNQNDILRLEIIKANFNCNFEERQRNQKHILDSECYITAFTNYNSGNYEGICASYSNDGLRVINIKDILFTEKQCIPAIVNGIAVYVSDNNTFDLNSNTETFISTDNDGYHITKDENGTMSKWKSIKLAY